MTLPAGGDRSLTNVMRSATDLAGTTVPKRDTTEISGRVAAASCCGPRALFGWSPPTLPADTPLKRRVDALMPRTGVALIAFYTAVIALLNIGLVLPLPRRLDLCAIGLASLAAGGWCAVNFWRCRHAHCAVTGPGLLALALFTFVEAGLGHSLIHGDEALLFLAVLAVGLAWEAAWYAARRTHAVPPRSTRA